MLIIEANVYTSCTNDDNENKYGISMVRFNGFNKRSSNER